MATERLSMRQIREVLRQKWVLGRPHREVAESLRIGLGTVCLVLDKAKQAGLDWPTVQTLTEEALEARLYTRPHVAVPERVTRPWPDCAYIHRERRKAGVTLELLHLEYLEQHPDGYRYTQYCEIYRRWLKHRGLSMRQVHRAGEKLFVDYSGKKPTIIDPATGEVTEVELFVAVLGASNYTYAEATRTQQVHDWIGSHERAFAFFGGVTEVVVPDQLKSGVTVPCRYEPGLQRTYEEFAQHCNTVILPARPKHPRDKPKAEVGVQVAQRWILARLRHERFFSLAALNARIRELLEPLNAKVMRVYRASRRELFVQLDQPVLRPLPAEPFVVGEWTIDARVNIDYHIDVHGHYYSVPYELLHERVDVNRPGFLGGSRSAMKSSLRRFWSERDLVAQAFKPADEVSSSLSLLDPVQVGGAEISVRDPSRQHVIGGDEDLMGDGHRRPLRAPSGPKAVELVAEVAALLVGR